MSKFLIRSSSFHRLNADKPLSPIQRMIWVLVNRINNLLLPNYMHGNLKKSLYHYEFSEDEWAKSQILISPARRLSELFLLKLPWDKIETELGEIHVVDVGCGKGGMAKLLQDFSGGRIKSYVGIDINAHSQWQDISAACPWVRFYECNSNDIREYIPRECTLVVSQSALEHFEDDLIFFREIRDFVDAQKKTLLQIHLFPSPACLELYGLHGVRQYTPRSVSMIAQLFIETSYSLLFPLGGEASNRVHQEYISGPLNTLGVDLREVKASEYDRQVKLAVMQDMTNNPLNPSFYALVIHSLHHNLIWD